MLINTPGMIQKNILVVLMLLCVCPVFAQTDTTATKDSLSGFDSFNQKAEHLFKILPVPLYSYSTEAGNTFGLAKFNLFNL